MTRQTEQHGSGSPPSEGASPNGNGFEPGARPADAANSGTDSRLPPVDSAAEDAYWREHYLARPYADDTLSYDHYRPAYRYGMEARLQYDGRRWAEVEPELGRGWRVNRGASRLGWSDASLAARDAWQRVDRRIMDGREPSMDEAVHPAT
ncbi:MAG TPA: hypothetical protein VK936_00705 [Longimicrobiales bacterium]|nr:hypothetical protein [Longimicrobiales bacterium]